jgi:ribosomal protein S13
MEEMKGGSFFSRSILQKFLGLSCANKRSSIFFSKLLKYKVLAKYYDIKKLELNVDDNYLRDEFILNSLKVSDINSWKAVRKTLNLPARGQSTRTNARTGKRLRSKDFFRIKEEEQEEQEESIISES